MYHFIFHTLDLVKSGLSLFVPRVYWYREIFTETLVYTCLDSAEIASEAGLHDMQGFDTPLRENYPGVTVSGFFSDSKQTTNVLPGFELLSPPGVHNGSITARTHKGCPTSKYLVQPLVGGENKSPYRLAETITQLSWISSPNIGTLMQTHK